MTHYRDNRSTGRDRSNFQANWGRMSIMASALLAWALCLCLTPVTAAAQRSGNPDNQDLDPTLILISIDGARHDYLQLHEAPALSELAAMGLQAHTLQPVFPTKTFTNHYTLVTGLYPARHGIVDNNMYDPQTQQRFSLGNREQVQNPYWWQGEPIWVTAAHNDMVSGTFFFPGSEAAIQGISPTYWFTYDESITNRTRVETVLEWLEMPDAERPQIITLYFSDVDTAGHNFGPASEQVAQAMHAVDTEIAYLIAGLKARGLFDQVNMMVTSDHGMAAVDLNNHIIIDEAFDPSLAEQVLYSRELVSIFPEPGQQDTIVATLQQNLPPQAQAYTQETLPERFRFSGHHRIAPVLVLAEPGWAMLRRSWLEGMLSDGTIDQVRGGHGYDNQAADMQGLFIAHGPAFRQPHAIDNISMVDLYNVMAAILGITPADNDGNPEVVSQLLRP